MQRLNHRTKAHGKCRFVTNVVIGRQEDNARQWLVLKDTQHGEQDADPGAAIARLGDNVAADQPP